MGGYRQSMSPPREWTAVVLDADSGIETARSIVARNREIAASEARSYGGIVIDLYPLEPRND